MFMALLYYLLVIQVHKRFLNVAFLLPFAFYWFVIFKDTFEQLFIERTLDLEAVEML